MTTLGRVATSALACYNRMKEEEDVRTNRDRFVKELRRAQREEKFQLSRKRMEELPCDHADNSKKLIIMDDRYADSIRNFLSAHYDTTHLQYYIDSLPSEDVAVQHEAVIAVRTIVAREATEPVIQRVVDSGAVPLLIGFMRDPAFPQLQYEACWIVTNISSGSSLQCQSIIDKGGIDVLLRILYENRPQLSRQALWGLGNIAGDCATFRDEILRKGGHQNIMRLVECSESTEVTRQGVWALCNLCRGTPLPKYEIIKPIIPLLCRHVASGVLSGNELYDALWTIASHTEGQQKSKVQRVLDVEGFVERLMALCFGGEVEALVPGLRVVGNISTGNDSQSEVLLRHGLLDLLAGLMEHKRNNTRREACWVLSNICGCRQKNVAQVLARPDILCSAAQLLATGSCDVRREVCYVFANITHAGESKAVHALLVELQVFETLLGIVMEPEADAKLMEVALMAIYELLAFVERIAQPNPFVRILERTPGCCEKMEQLQYHPSHEVYKLVVKIFQRFLSLEEVPVI